MSDSHINKLHQSKTDELIALRQQNGGLSSHRNGRPINDEVYITQKLRNIFKRRLNKGICSSVLSIFYVPLTFLRNYTIPIAEEDQWNKVRASLLPSTIIISFFYLFGMLNGLGSDKADEAKSSFLYLVIGLGAMVPGIIIGLFIYFKTTRTQPPQRLLTIYAMCAFGMSIAWVNFASNLIVDLLKLFGFITTLP